MPTNKFIKFYPGQLVVCNNSQWYNASSLELDAVATDPVFGKEYSVTQAVWVKHPGCEHKTYCIELKEFPGIFYNASSFEPAMLLKSINSLDYSLTQALQITKPQRN